MKVVSFDVGCKNLAYCVIEECAEGKRIVHWEVVDLKNTSRDSICASVVSCMDARPFLLEANAVVIEKQPAKNNSMRIIEALLNAYFVIKGVPKVVIYSAKHKLGSVTIKGKAGYRDRKRLGVNRCAEYVKCQSDSVQAQFHSSKKKDDLADCLLQGLSYMGDAKFTEITHMQVDCICKIVARKPTKKQESTMYSKSNIKFFLKDSTFEESMALVETNEKLRKALLRFYGPGADGMRSARKELSLGA